MSYTIHQAKTQFSRLIKEAEAGKEVIVTRGKKPVAKISAIEPAPMEQVPFRLLGAYRDKIRFDDSLFNPLTDKELREMGFDDLADTPLIPPARNS